MKDNEQLVSTDHGAEVGAALWRDLQGPGWEARMSKVAVRSDVLSHRHWGM